MEDSTENDSDNETTKRESASDNEEKSESPKKELTPEKKSPKEVHSFFSKSKHFEEVQRENIKCMLRVRNEIAEYSRSKLEEQ